MRLLRAALEKLFQASQESCSKCPMGMKHHEIKEGNSSAASICRYQSHSHMEDGSSFRAIGTPNRATSSELPNLPRP